MVHRTVSMDLKKGEGKFYQLAGIAVSQSCNHTRINIHKNRFTMETALTVDIVNKHKHITLL